MLSGDAAVSLREKLEFEKRKTSVHQLTELSLSPCRTVARLIWTMLGTNVTSQRNVAQIYTPNIGIAVDRAFDVSVSVAACSGRNSFHGGPTTCKRGRWW